MRTDAPPRPTAGESVTNHHTGETMMFLGVHRDDRGDARHVRTTLPPGGKGPPTHVHPNQVEEGTVLAGRVAVRVGGAVREHGPGEHVVFPAGSAHTWWNAGDEPLVVEGRLRPPLNFEPFIREMFGAMNASRDGTPSFLDGVDILGRYPRDQQLPGVPAWVQRRGFPVVAGIARTFGAYRRRDADAP